MMNDFSVSRPGGLRAGPKLSCWTILKSLKLDTAQPRGRQSRRKSFSHYKLYNQRVRAGARGSLGTEYSHSHAFRKLYNNTILTAKLNIFEQQCHEKNYKHNKIILSPAIKNVSISHFHWTHGYSKYFKEPPPSSL